MALGANFTGQGNAITVTIGDVTVGGIIITAQGTPACVSYLDVGGNQQYDAILMVTVYDPGNPTAQPAPVGLFELQTGNVLVTYTVPAGATNVEYSLGDCGAYLADLLNTISVNISNIETLLNSINNTLTNIESIVTNIDSTLTDVFNELVSILNTLNTISNTVTNIENNTADIANSSTLIQYFCDQFGEGNTERQRFITIYVINNDTGLVAAQSNWYNNPANNNAIEPYTIQGTVGGIDCCPPDDCPPVIGTQYLCLQTIDPCISESWNLIITLEPLANAEVTLAPITGNNAGYTVAWTGFDGVSPDNPTGVTTPLTITGSGTIVADITVTLADGSTCPVTLVATISCDAELAITQETSTIAYKKKLRFPIPSMIYPFIMLAVDTYIYTSAEYTLQTGNPDPDMTDPAAVQAFLNWIAAQHPTDILFYLESYDPLVPQNSIFMESCIDLPISVVLSTYGAINQLDLGTTTNTTLVCDNAICLTATFAPGPDSVAVNTTLTWQLSPGLTLITGTLSDQTICVTGSGTAIVTAATTICGDFTETTTITSSCDAAQINIVQTPGATVCAGIHIDNVLVDDVGRRVRFLFSAADTNTGVGVISALFTQILLGNVLDPFAYPTDPDYIEVLNINGNSGSITLPFPHFSMQSTVPIYDQDRFSYLQLGAIAYPIAGGLPWNEATDPDGAIFEAQIQAFIDPIGPATNTELHAGVYVVNHELYLVIRVYADAGGAAPTYTNCYFVQTNTAGDRFTIKGFTPFTTGVSFVRLVQTDCGIIGIGHVVRVVPTDWTTTIAATVQTTNEPISLPLGPFFDYPQCCTIPDTLTANIDQGTPIAYAWTVSAGVSIVGGNALSNTIQITGTGTVTIAITTAECGVITKTITIT